MIDQIIDSLMKPYEGKGFNDKQLRQIRYGLELGLDVSIYADLKFDHMQMNQIKWGLESGIDVSKYTDPKLYWDQMQKIRNELNWAKLNKIKS